MSERAEERALSERAEERALSEREGSQREWGARTAVGLALAPDRPAEERV